MKRKIFTFVSTLALSAALIVSAQAASPDCTLQSSAKSCPSPIFCTTGSFCVSERLCFPGNFCIPCPEVSCPDVSCPDTPDTPELPDQPDTPELPDTPETPSTPDTPDDGASASVAQQVLALVNRERAANGLSALSLDDTLSRYAAIKSQDMHDNHYFSHTSPTYGSPFDMMKSFGITYNYAGENIAMGYSTAEAVVTAWMNSAGHRANILSANFTTMGIGYVSDGGYWTQWFLG